MHPRCCWLAAWKWRNFICFQATGWQHLCSAMFLKMGGINAQNMLTWLELLINCYCCIYLVFILFICMYCVVCISIMLWMYMRGDPKIFGIFTKNVFKIFIQVWNFSLLRSTPSVTGCSDPSAAPPAGSIVLNLQQKWCQGPPAILAEPLQCQQNTFISNLTSSMGTKKKVTRRRLGK